MPLGAARITLLAFQPTVEAEGLQGISLTSGNSLAQTFTVNDTDSRQITVSGWIRLKYTTTQYIWIWNLDYGRITSGPFIYQGGNASFRHYTQTQSHTEDDTSAENNLYVPDEWVHFAYSYDFGFSNSARAYVNGQRLSMSGSSAFASLADYTNRSYTFNMNVRDDDDYDVAQVWIDNSYINLDEEIEKFYKDGPVDLGTDGTATGLPQPLIYHYGNSSDFLENKGRLSYTLGVTGSIGDVEVGSYVENDTFWSDWISDDVGDVAVIPSGASTGSQRCSGAVAFDETSFYNIGNNNSNRDNILVEKFNISPTGEITFDSLTEYNDRATLGESELQFGNKSIVKLARYRKCVFTLGSKYYVFKQSQSGDLTMNDQETFDTGYAVGDYDCWLAHPTDPDIWYTGRTNGVLQKFTWDDSTETFTGNVVTANQSTTQGNIFLIEVGAAYQIAFFYWDGSNYIVKRYDLDLNEVAGSSITLNSTPTPTDNNLQRRATVNDQQVNWFVFHNVDGSENRYAFSVYWNGTTFVQGSTLTLNPPSAYSSLIVRGVFAGRFVDDNTYITQAQLHDSPETGRLHVVDMIKLDQSTGNLTQTECVAVSDFVNSGNIRGGVDVTPNKKWIAISTEGRTDSTEGKIYSVFKKPTIRDQVGVSAVGNAQVDTAQSKFGVASALFDGSSDALIATGETLTYGDGDFTIECWFRRAATGNNWYIFDQRDGVEANVPTLLYNTSNNFGYYTAGSYRIQASFSYSVGTWYHIAISRSGNTTRMFIDGTQVGSFTDNFTYNYADLTIGAFYNYASGGVMNGHLDEFRVSNTARYTSNFTPQTQPFVNDANTLLLLHMDGTDGSTEFTDDVGRF